MTRKLRAGLMAALLLLALATYVYYRRTLAARPLDPYALVPADAVLVLATRDHPALVRHLQEAGLWDKLSATRPAQQLAGILALADSLDSGGRPGSRRRGLLDLLGRQLVLTSWHQTGPRQVDVLVQVPLGSVPDYRRARGLLEALGRDPRYRLSTRRYEGYDLRVLAVRSGATRPGGALTVLNYRNQLVMSTSAALVEAVVQRLSRPAAPTVRAGFGDTDLLRLREVDATLLINFRRLPGLLDVYFQPGTHARLDEAAGLAGEALLGLKFEAGQLVLSGFANPPAPAGDHRTWAGALAGQPGLAPRPLAEVLPLRAALVLAVGGPLPPGALVSDNSASTNPVVNVPAAGVLPDSVGISGANGANRANGESGRTVARLVALDSLRASLRPGAALVYLAAPALGATPGVVAVWRCGSAARAGRWLARLRRLGRVSPAFTRVGSYAMQEAGFAEEQLLSGSFGAGGTSLQEFPHPPRPPSALVPTPASNLTRNPTARALASPPLAARAAAPAPTLRTALVGDYLLLGDAAALRAYLTEVAAGQVWSRSPTHVAWLRQAQPLARVTVLADLRLGWNALLGGLAEEHRAEVLRDESLLRHFPQVVWQLVPPALPADEARPGARYFAQLLLRRPGQEPVADEAGAGDGSLVRRFLQALSGQPLLLPPGVGAGLAAGTAADMAAPLPAAPGPARPAVLVADSAGRLRCLTAAAGAAGMAPRAALATAWTDSLPGPVVGAGPRLVRGRLLLATAHRLHWLSPADGLEAPGFPLNLPDSVTVAAVVGAAASPRLVVATTARDLLLFDTNGRRYAGWPRRLEAPLAGPPLLLSVGGRDVVVAALANGYVYAFDQAGGRYPGFPVSAGARLTGPVLAETGPTLARTTLRLVNQHGELLTLSLSGDILARRRVATWSRSATFRLVPAETESDGGGGRPAAESRSFVVVRQDGGQLDIYAGAGTGTGTGVGPGPGSGPPLLSQRRLTSGDKPVQWFDFGAGHQVLALTEPLPGQVSLFDGRGQPLGAKASWPSTGAGVALRYDAAGRRYVLLRLVGRELRQELVAGQ